MNFIIHRGTHEIGGSCVEITSDHGCRVVIDIGMPLVDKKSEKFEQKEYEKLTGPELIKAGILPNIRGFYNWDKENKIIDGILISHPHIDHYGFFKHLNPEIPYFLGEASKKIIDITVQFTPLEGFIKNHSAIESGEGFYIKDFKITPYLMDHSAFDSYAFLIEADGKKLFYSGDFRAHGRKAKAFEWFLTNGPNKVDVLLLEGTMLGRIDEKVKSEQDIESESVEIFKNSTGMVLLYFSAQNIDRFVSFYLAAVKTKKKFVIDVYMANVLQGLHDLENPPKLPYPSLKWPVIKVCFPYWICKRLSNQGKKELMYKFRKYKITREQISKNQKNIVMMVRPSILIDLKKIKDINSGAFVYSLWEGYLKDIKTKELLEFTKKKDMPFYFLHTSGHAPVKTLQKMVKKLNPETIIPIHTFEPEKYREIFGDSVQIPSDGEIFEVHKSKTPNL